MGGNMKKRRTRRKTAHWIIEYNHAETCPHIVDGHFTMAGKLTPAVPSLTCQCGGVWTRVHEEFFDHPDKPRVREGALARPRSLTLIMRTLLERKELLESWAKRDVHYRIKNIRTKETYPIEAFSS